MQSAKFLTQWIVAVQLVVAALALGGVVGCGKTAASGSDATTDDSIATGTDDVGAGDAPGHDAIAVNTTQVESTVISPVIQINDQGQQDQSAIKATFVRPLDCTATAPCPLVIVVGDYDPAPYPLYTDPAKKLAALVHWLNAAWPTPPISPTAPTPNSASTTCVTTWSTPPPKKSSAATTTRLSMKSTTS